MRRALLGLGLLAVWAPLAGAATVEVAIRDYRFEPATVTIHPGDTVRWVNQEKRVSHSVYFTNPALESDRMFPGEAWTRTFPEAGRHTYHCGPHPEMEGVVVVE